MIRALAMHYHMRSSVAFFLCRHIVGEIYKITKCMLLIFILISGSYSHHARISFAIMDAPSCENCETVVHNNNGGGIQLQDRTWVVVVKVHKILWVF